MFIKTGRLLKQKPTKKKWSKKLLLWSRKWQPTPVLLPGKVYGQRSVASCSPWGRKELDTAEQLSPNKQGPTLIQVDLISKSTITCTKIAFPNKVIFAGSGGYNGGIPLGATIKPAALWKKKVGAAFPLLLCKLNTYVHTNCEMWIV